MKQTVGQTNKQYRNEDSLQTENDELLETWGFNQIDEQERTMMLTSKYMPKMLPSMALQFVTPLAAFVCTRKRRQ